MLSDFDIAMSASITALFVSAGLFVQALAALAVSTVLVATREED